MVCPVGMISRGGSGSSRAGTRGRGRRGCFGWGSGVLIRVEGDRNGGQRVAETVYEVQNTTWQASWRSWCCPDGSIWSPDKAGKHRTLPSLFLLSSVINTCTFVYQTVTKRTHKRAHNVWVKIYFPHFYVLGTSDMHRLPIPPGSYLHRHQMTKQVCYGITFILEKMICFTPIQLFWFLKKTSV